MDNYHVPVLCETYTLDERLFRQYFSLMVCAPAGLRTVYLRANGRLPGLVGPSNPNLIDGMFMTWVLQKAPTLGISPAMCRDVFRSAPAAEGAEGAPFAQFLAAARIASGARVDTALEVAITWLIATLLVAEPGFCEYVTRDLAERAIDSGSADVLNAALDGSDLPDIPDGVVRLAMRIACGEDVTEEMEEAELGEIDVRLEGGGAPADPDPEEPNAMGVHEAPPPNEDDFDGEERDAESVDDLPAGAALLEEDKAEEPLGNLDLWEDEEEPAVEVRDDSEYVRVTSYLPWAAAIVDALHVRPKTFRGDPTRIEEYRKVASALSGKAVTEPLNPKTWHWLVTTYELVTAEDGSVASDPLSTVVTLVPETPDAPAERETVEEILKRLDRHLWFCFQMVREYRTTSLDIRELDVAIETFRTEHTIVDADVYNMEPSPFYKAQINMALDELRDDSSLRDDRPQPYPEGESLGDEPFGCFANGAAYWALCALLCLASALRRGDFTSGKDPVRERVRLYEAFMDITGAGRAVLLEPYFDDQNLSVFFVSAYMTRTPLSYRELFLPAKTTRAVLARSSAILGDVLLYSCRGKSAEPLRITAGMVAEFAMRFLTQLAARKAASPVVPLSERQRQNLRATLSQSFSGAVRTAPLYVMDGTK